MKDAKKATPSTAPTAIPAVGTPPSPLLLEDDSGVSVARAVSAVVESVVDDELEEDVESVVLEDSDEVDELEDDELDRVDVDVVRRVDEDVEELLELRLLLVLLEERLLELLLLDVERRVVVALLLLLDLVDVVCGLNAPEISEPMEARSSSKPCGLRRSRVSMATWRFSMWRTPSRPNGRARAADRKRKRWEKMRACLILYQLSE